jgi:prephenate dehydrogenase
MKKVQVGIIGGTRGMGRWFAAFLRKQGCTVTVCDERTAVTPADVARSCDVVIVSVPIGITVGMIETIGPFLKKESLLMDLTSLKAAPVAAMLAYSRSEVIGCHPLFGPRVRFIRGRSVCLCPVRTRRWLPWLRATLQEAGALIVETTPEEHDHRMALVQGLNHLNSLLMGMVLSEAGMPLTDLRPFSTPAFEEKMNLVRKTLHPNPRLSAEIIALNPEIHQIIDLYEKMLAELKIMVGNSDTEGVAALMNRRAAALWPAG